MSTRSRAGSRRKILTCLALGVAAVLALGWLGLRRSVVVEWSPTRLRHRSSTEYSIAGMTIAPPGVVEWESALDRSLRPRWRASRLADDWEVVIGYSNGRAVNGDLHLVHRFLRCCPGSDHSDVWLFWATERFDIAELHWTEFFGSVRQQPESDLELAARLLVIAEAVTDLKEYRRRARSAAE